MTPAALSGLPTIHLLKGQIPRHILSSISEYAIMSTHLHKIIIDLSARLACILFLARAIVSLSILYDLNLP